MNQKFMPEQEFLLENTLQDAATTAEQSGKFLTGANLNILYEARASDSPFIESIWHTQSDVDDDFTSTANGRWDMMIFRQAGETRVMVTGAMTRAQTIPHVAGSEWLGIRFKLGISLPHFSAGSLVDEGIDLPDASGKAFWLQGASWQFPNFENADTFVDRLVHDELLVRDSVVESVLQNDPQAWSVRSIQYRFVKATGLTQKAIQQIERARRAAALLEQGVPILDTAYQLGYFDQAHLTNSLKRFTGQTPAQLARATGAK